MPKQLLHRLNVIASLQEMRREGVPEGVTAGPLPYPRAAGPGRRDRPAVAQGDNRLRRARATNRSRSGQERRSSIVFTTPRVNQVFAE
jgi:hypothetical protein